MRSSGSPMRNSRNKQWNILNILLRKFYGLKNYFKIIYFAIKILNSEQVL